MKIQKLLADIVCSLKAWVQTGFDEVAGEIQEREKTLRAWAASELKSLGDSIEKRSDDKIQEMENRIYAKEWLDKAGLIAILEEKTAQFDEKLQKAINEIPKPENGKDGADGKSITVDDVRPLLEELVKEIPQPQDGKSVTLGDVEPLLKSFVEQAVAAIPAPKDGKSVTVDDVLPAIEAKINEKFAEIPKPRDGKDGAPGAPGEPGKDATQIEIQPSVDFDKSYPRGTYALHNGGVIKSYMQTSGEKGWEVAQNGIASINLSQEGERNVAISIKMTDGKEEKAVFNLPHMIYRGIYKEGFEYQKGDTATWGGSLWHCDTDTREKPGNSDDWSLCAKRGRDGK